MSSDARHTAKASKRALTLKASVSFITFMGASALVNPAIAQTIILDGDNVTVTSQANGETISAAAGVTSTVDGAPVVLIANDDVTLDNAGTLATINGSQTVQAGPDTVGAIINNAATGILNGDSRVVQIDGDGATLNNDGQIIGTGDQRNGTVYTNATATDFTLNNTGTIDAGAGNLGAGFSAEGVAEGTVINVNNSGTIQGRGQAGAGLATAGDGIRFERTRVAGALDATTSALFSGTIENSGTIASESLQGTAAGIRFVNGVSFNGTINNSGTISGAQNGLYFGNATPAGGGDFTGAVVNNTGIISSDSRAFNLDGTGLTVNNAGQIIGTADQRNGTFYADGTADNFTINNLEGGVIDAGLGNTGSGLGLEIGGAADGANTFTLVNDGTIQGRGNASAADNAAGDGIRVGNVGNIGVAEGTITNNGLIASEGANGTVAGVRFVNGISFAGTFDNNGTITGVQNGVYFGNAVDGEGADHSNGVFNNNVDGIISSDSRAFNLDGTGLTVNNAGQIIGTANQRNGTFYADGTADDFTINNLEGGVIDAGLGNTGSGLGLEIGSAADGANTFTLVNDGTIQGRGNASAADNAAGDGIRVGNVGNIGVAEGTITNNGLIASEGANGTVAGVRFVNGISFSGTFDNNGTITGVQNGVYFGNAVDGEGADHSNGVFNNNVDGVISSDSRAFNIDGTGLTLNNAGTIIGTGVQRNGTLYSDGTATNFTVNNSGTIDAGVEGSGFAAEIGPNGNTFTFDNSGTIQGRGTVDAADGFRVGNPGNIGTATVAITNSGLINSESTTGTTAGLRFVNGISFAGTIDNSGTISGAQNGVYFGNAVNGEGADHSNGVFNNLVGGIISSDSRAFNIDGTGLTLNNAGTIVATGTQRNGTVYADSTAQDFTLNNLASGVIDAGEGLEGAAFSVELSEAGNDFTINNDGLIQGRGQAGAGVTAAGDGLRFERTRVGGALDGTTTGLFTGNITNTGTIASESLQGTTAGIRFVNGVSFSGTIDNSGTISGAQNGLYFGNATPAGGGDFTGAVVNNTGIISSDSRAFNLDGTGLTVNNSGQIIGTGTQRNGTFYADATADNYTLNNLAGGVIDAGLGNQGSGVSLQSGDVDGDIVTLSITNDGTIAGRGEALASGATAGLRIFAGSTNVTVNGDITNTGTITSETGPAVLIEGVNYTGTITNSGTLTGPAAFDASAALGAINFVNSGTLNGDFIGSSFTDTLTFQGASTLAGSILGGVETVFDGETTISGLQNIEGNVIANGTLNLLLAQDSLAVDGDFTFGENSIVNVFTADDVTQTVLGAPISVISETGLFTNNGVQVNVQDDDFLIDYDVLLGSVTITASAADLAGVSDDTNISAFGGALTSAFAAGQLDATVANALNDVTNATEFEDAALSLLPAINDASAREVFETHGLVDQFVERRLASDAPRGVWVEGFGRTAVAATESRSSVGYDADAFGVAIGADTQLNDQLTVGASFNYANINIDSAGVSAQETDLDSFAISTYAGYRSGASFFNGQIGYIFGSGDTARAGLTGPITSESGVNAFTAQATAGHDFKNGAWTITPQAGLRFATVSQDEDDVTEVGGLGLTVDVQSVQYLDARIGADVAGDFGGFKPFVRGSYVYDLIGDETVFDVNFDGAAAPFALETDGPAQSRFEIGTGFDFQVGNGVSIGIAYDGEFSDDYQSHGGFIRARVAF